MNARFSGLCRANRRDALIEFFMRFDFMDLFLPSVHRIAYFMYVLSVYCKSFPSLFIISALCSIRE